MNYSSDSDYELLSSANLEHESDSELYTNPYIDSDGEIYYGDTRPADWDAAKSIATELGDDTGKYADTSDLKIIFRNTAHRRKYQQWTLRLLLKKIKTTEGHHIPP